MRKHSAGIYPPAYRPLGVRFEETIVAEFDAIEAAEIEAVRQIQHGGYFQAIEPGRKTYK
jgi:hypothetical protein